MPFNTLTFGLFFLVVLGLYHAIPGWRGRKAVLLVASYLFYSAWNPLFIFLLFFATVTDWWLARRIAASDDPGRRRVFLILSLVSNLGLLGYFKYGGFLLASFQQAVAPLGWQYVPPAWDIVLPVGISFYTFQSLSYTIDVYRRQIRADASLSDFALFVSFFPQLVAGPIVRAVTFLPQLLERRRVSADQMGWGLCLMIFGLFQKVVLADGVFAPVVDEFYAAPARVGLLEAWTAVLAFSGQIFCDFAGYSTCAIGAALCFGFELPDNFKSPYGAVGFADFWHRWHISLSTWLRDYLYIPLGGNRLGPTRTSVNLMLTMLIGGLWHGASWMFVLWGGLHGLYLLLERQWRRWRPVAASGEGTFPAALLTFIVVSLTWVPFRSPDVATFTQALGGLARLDVPVADSLPLTLVSLMTAMLLMGWHWRMRHDTLEHWFSRLTDFRRMALLGGAMTGIFLASGGEHRAFIYFQF